jgi:hypothetical protein
VRWRPRPGRPDRATRRRNGKSDRLDAQAAARAALAGHGVAVPRPRTEPWRCCESSELLAGRRWRPRVQAGNQLHALLARAPEELREQYRQLPARDVSMPWSWGSVHAGCGSDRPSPDRSRC